ncbi:MAG: YciI family protein [Verrucomicrobiota bacterium JB022]|nr:YciI family protein [Verrucomicrobiota bacterium JB022]
METSAETKTPPQYMLLIRNNEWDRNYSPAELQGALDRIFGWFDNLSESGVMVDGKPLFERCMRVSRQGGRTVVDGPFAESKEAVAGFVILNISTMEESVEIASSAPHLDYGMTIEVRPLAESCPVYMRTRQYVEALA